MALLSEGLLPASFRGVPFAVEADDLGGGRRQAVHLYPKRDTPWPEDMGRAPRVFRFRGFIVDGDVVFAGGPIQLQRALLLAALEKEGPGTLTHPTLGVLKVSVTRFSLGADLGAGRKSSVDLEFIESGKKSFPSLLTSGSGLLSAATLADVAIAADFVRAATIAFGEVGGSQIAAASTSSWSAQMTDAAGDATALQRLAALLPGNNGRYASGATAGINGSTPTPYSSDISVDALIADASAQRQAVAVATNGVAVAMQAAGPAGGANDLATAVQAQVAALLAACSDPADAVRLLLQLLTFTGASSVMTMLFQRAVATALARAGALYQPSSYDDAFALLSKVSDALDAVATAAADAGDDASYAALRTLRVEVVADLRARGAGLARVSSFILPAPMPALAIAQRLYRDPDRGDELVGEVDPIHPLFMPTSFQALAA